MGCKHSLIYAAREGREDDLKWLLFDQKIPADVHEARTKRTPLHLAACKGRISCVKLLLQAGANHAARDVNGLTPLHLAVYHGRTSCVELLLNSGAKVDSRSRFGCTPLHNAAYFEKYACAKLLLKYGADVNSVESWGQTPLLLAAQKGSADMIQLLIYHGAIINVVSKVQSESPLHAACNCRDLPCMQMLLDAGADTTVKNSKGRTCLHEVVADGQACDKLVQLLLAYGAQVHVADDNGETVLDIVKKQSNKPFASTDHFRKYDFITTLLQSVEGSPMPLGQICKICIRRTLGPSKIAKIEDLDIPQVLKENLANENMTSPTVELPKSVETEEDESHPTDIVDKDRLHATSEKDCSCHQVEDSELKITFL